MSRSLEKHSTSDRIPERNKFAKPEFTGLSTIAKRNNPNSFTTEPALFVQTVLPEIQQAQNKELIAKIKQ